MKDVVCSEKVFLNIKQVCEKRMQELFPAGVPDFARKRLDMEYKYLSGSPVIEDFELYRLISQAMAEAGMHIAVWGTAAGSMIAYLIGNSYINPLPAYYYCPKCGKYEEVKNLQFGIDLPDMLCIECSSPMDHDGVNIELPFIWGIHGDRVPYFDYRVSEDTYLIIKHMLEKIYSECKVYPLGISSFDAGSDKKCIIREGLAILPEGTEYNYFPEFVSFLDTGVPCIVGDPYELGCKHIKSIIVHEDNLEAVVTGLRLKTGVSVAGMDLLAISKIPWNEYIKTGCLSNAETHMFESFTPVTFKEKAELIAAGHNTYKKFSQDDRLNGYLDEKIMKESCFAEYPCFTRETIYEAFRENGLSTEEAFILTEMVRKGISGLPKGHKMKIRWREKIADHPEIPESLIKVSECYRYVTSRVIALNHLFSLGMISYYNKIIDK